MTIYGREGVEVHAGRDVLEAAMLRLIRSRSQEEIVIPEWTGVYNWRWVFKDGRDFAVTDCSREQLLEIVESLGKEVQRLCQQTSKT